MKIEYRVLNPLTGTYTNANTLEEADVLAKQIAWEFFVSHTYSTPINKVVVTDEGAEIWGTPDA